GKDKGDRLRFPVFPGLPFAVAQFPAKGAVPVHEVVHQAGALQFPVIADGQAPRRGRIQHQDADLAVGGQLVAVSLHGPVERVCGRASAASQGSSGAFPPPSRSSSRSFQLAVTRSSASPVTGGTGSFSVPQTRIVWSPFCTPCRPISHRRALWAFWVVSYPME